MGKSRKHKKTRKSSEQCVDEIYESVKRDVSVLASRELPNGDPFVVPPGVADVLYAIRSTDKALAETVEKTSNPSNDSTPDFFKQRETGINRTKLNKRINSIELTGLDDDSIEAIKNITPPLIKSDKPYPDEIKNGSEDDVIYGHWIHDKKEAPEYVNGFVYLRSCTCSVCGEHRPYPIGHCTYCGAVMDEG